MKKTKLILIVCFVLVFAAGAALGVFATGWNEHPTRGSWLARELNLTPEQRNQIQAIWAQTTEPGGRQQRVESAQQRDESARQRDDAVSALLANALTEDEQTQYAKIQETYQQKIDNIAEARKKADDARRKAFNEKVEQTKKVLTLEQAAKYEELMKRQRDRSHEGSAPGSRGPRSHRDGSTDRPDTDR